MKFIKKVMSVAMTSVILFGSLCMNLSADGNQGIIDFVTRCYDIALNRTPDKESLDAWVQKLSSGEECGVSVAYGFVYSPEFQSAGFSNDEYVEKMYNMLLGRPSDAEGKKMWVDRLNSGSTSAKDDIFYGFANSEEFYNLCLEYDIFAGFYNPTIDNATNAKINGFVDRFYSICLSRHGDILGQSYWAKALADGEVTGTTLAYGFIFSNEFIGSDTSNEYFVEVLYNTFMGRTQDSLGVVWKQYLDRGSMSRDEVFDSFSSSTEFKMICSDYGIIAGEPCAMDNAEAKEELLFSAIYNNKILEMVFDNEKANIDIDPVNVFYGESEEECGIITNQKFYNNFKNASAIGSYFNGENYYYTSKDDTVCIRIYCKEASDEVLFYGYSSTLFYGLDYENYSTQQFDGENYYYDFTYKMPFNLFDYTQDVNSSDNQLILFVSDEKVEHFYYLGVASFDSIEVAG